MRKLSPLLVVRKRHFEESRVIRCFSKHHGFFRTDRAFYNSHITLHHLPCARLLFLILQSFRSRTVPWILHWYISEDLYHNWRNKPSKLTTEKEKMRERGSDYQISYFTNLHSWQSIKPRIIVESWWSTSDIF